MRTHRMSKGCREYIIWKHMRQRCNNPKDRGFPNYGGRGIKVCDRWNDFRLFYQDMGPRPTPKHSLDRVDNDGDYTPQNCRWATRIEQMNNRSLNHWIEIEGRAQTISQWSRETGVPAHRICVRIEKGWLPETAATLPVLATGTFTWKGETRTIRGWSAHLMVPLTTLYWRFQQGWPLAEALAPNYGRAKLLLCKGETRTVSEWSAISGVTQDRIYERMKDGWAAEKAVFTPVRKFRRRTVKDE